ncbi:MULTISPECIES: HNH endonuclease [Sphingobium]|uniref:HNH endonuclease n=1 Tax=Sphingobium TaxID=165695 RepID=UPI00159C830F|nr:HNH endonuclease [Sphingobium sp. 15-1]
MIRLKRAPVPSKLDASKISELTDQFKADGSSVWNKSFIKKPLLASSSGKCAFCEAKIDEESKYMEVEHFRCKKHHPNLVVIWDNLLPSCKRCNGEKGEHNVVTDGMIVDPYVDNPNKHLYLRNFRLYEKDDIGKETIRAVYLNDSDRVVRLRFEIGTEVCEALCTIKEDVDKILAGDTSLKTQKKVVRAVHKLLNEAQPSEQYSATVATVLLADPNYMSIRSYLEGSGIWSQFQELEDKAKKNALF